MKAGEAVAVEVERDPLPGRQSDGPTRHVDGAFVARLGADQRDDAAIGGGDGALVEHRASFADGKLEHELL